MAVLVETTRGDIVIDLHTSECPRTTKNFLKLCKIKYYNNVLFHRVTKDFVVLAIQRPRGEVGTRYINLCMAIRQDSLRMRSGPH